MFSDIYKMQRNAKNSLLVPGLPSHCIVFVVVVFDFEDYLAQTCQAFELQLFEQGSRN